MPFTTYTDNKVLDAINGKATYTAPTNLYLGLSTTTPTTAGANVTEPSGGSYARVTVPAASMGTASAGSSANTAVINFATPTAAWGTITYAVMYDASTAGNLVWFAQLPSSQVVSSGVNVSIPIGQLTNAVA